MIEFRNILKLILILVLIPNLCIGQTESKYIPVVQNDLYGFITKDGDMAIAPQFDYAQSFSEELAAVRTTNGKWGYIDSTGSFVIEPVYDHASHFGQGLGFVGKEGKFGFVNSQGEMVIEPKFDGGGSFNGALANVLAGDKWGYIGTDGQYVIEPQFDGAENFHEGLARTCVAPEGGDCFRSDGKKFGFIDKNGKPVIPAKFDYAEHFSDGLAMAQIDGMYGFINRTGEWAVEPVYTNAGMAFSEGLAKVTTKNGEDLFINSSGEVILQQPAGHITGELFTNGLIMTMDRNSDKWGFMDIEGNLTIPINFDLVLPFKNGIAPAMSGDKWGLIDIKGEWKVEPAFNRIGPLH